jgi:lipopolysaccharide/colanic/teichoic acid biosynthesis glycosyltransferase
MKNRRFFKMDALRAERAEVQVSAHAVAGLHGHLVGPARTRPESSSGAHHLDQPLPIMVTDDGVYHHLRRSLEIAISIVALALFFLMLPFLAVIIRLDSAGPIFFIQERIGQNRRRNQRVVAAENRRKVIQPGRPIRVIKLRTMTTDAESAGPQWAQRNDARITRVGHFLRKTRLDEVPQFINVLKGEMSLIGPRPERLCFIRQLEKIIPNYRDRLLVPPGITGLAQVLNGYDSDTESVRRKVDLDRAYIQRCGVWMDLRILLSTVRVVLTGHGAV